MSCLDKVAAFVTRDSAAGREILVFEHPNAGRQIPAGTVDPGEEVFAAALREVEEETGLADGGTLTLLGEESVILPEPWRGLLADARVRGDNPQPWWPTDGVVTRGNQVRLVEVQSGLAYCVLELRVSPDRSEVAQVACVVALEALTREVRRSFFQLAVTQPTPERWVWTADGHTWELHWAPLSGDCGLAPPQSAWATRYAGLLA